MSDRKACSKHHHISWLIHVIVRSHFWIAQTEHLLNFDPMKETHGNTELWMQSIYAFHSDEVLQEAKIYLGTSVSAFTCMCASSIITLIILVENVTWESRGNALTNNTNSRARRWVNNDRIGKPWPSDPCHYYLYYQKPGVFRVPF